MGRIATIGFFDGVHRGHRYLFEQMAQIGHARGLEPLIVTFEQHPRAALQADYIPKLLSTKEERKELLSAYGEVLMMPFEQVQPMTAEQFMAWLKTHYEVSVLVMGYDHRFGSDRIRHSLEYQHIGQTIGMEVITLGEFIDGEWHVSSTEIRSALESGNIAVVNELLSRPYSIHGTVVHGRGIGRTIGFPTANIAISCPEKMLPGNGVYAVLVKTDTMDEYRPAMLNIGTNPTIGNNERTIEVHIPGYEGDLYGREMKILFERFIRDEKQFESIEELRRQIAEDISKL